MGMNDPTIMPHINDMPKAQDIPSDRGHYETTTSKRLAQYGLRIVQSIDFANGGFAYSVTGSGKLPAGQHFKTYPTKYQAAQAALRVMALQPMKDSAND